MKLYQQKNDIFASDDELCKRFTETAWGQGYIKALEDVKKLGKKIIKQYDKPYALIELIQQLSDHLVLVKKKTK
jgi:hypothetical protein